MDAHSISGSACELDNGVYIEELLVHVFQENGLPDSAQTIVRVDAYVPGTGNYPDKSVHRIMLDKSQEPYLWSMDSATYYMKVDSNARHRQLYRYIETTDSIERVSGIFGVPGQVTFKQCPLIFKPETWYYLHISDPGVSAVYVYVDAKNTFKLHTIDSGVSPI